MKPLPEDRLALALDNLKDFQIRLEGSDKGHALDFWIKTELPKILQEAKREIEVLSERLMDC